MRKRARGKTRVRATGCRGTKRRRERGTKDYNYNEESIKENMFKKLTDEKIKEGCLGTTEERESTKCCRSNSNSKSCCIADLKYNNALLLLDTPSH